MGWLESLFAPSEKDDNPLRKLDPKLREFLEKESPVKVTTASPKQKPSPPAQPAAPRQQQEQDAPVVPRESLYPDGRYAHLWKTYRSKAEVDAETKSDQEKLMDVLDGYKERKAKIGRVALENCAMEQADWAGCMKDPSFADRMTMCRTEVRKFERCYEMQAKLLKALGYMSTYDRPASVDEEIQLHADKLFHRMLEQEEAIEKAKKEGREPPKFAPLLPKEELKVDGETETRWKEMLDKLPVEQRDAELAAMKADRKDTLDMGRRLEGLLQEQGKKREARRTEGKETFGDKVVKFWNGN